MKWTVDSIKEGWVRIENEEEETLTVPISFLPKGICEGDIILIQKDEQSTETRKKEIKALMDSVWKD